MPLIAQVGVVWYGAGKGELGCMVARQESTGEDAAVNAGSPSMRRIARGVSWVNVVGFALCQVWNVLCVALPDPVTYGEPFHDLRWLSLLTALAACVAAVLRRQSVLASAHRVSAFVAIAAVSAASSLLGPVSVLFPAVSELLIHLAAVGVGVGFAGLFVLWYVRLFETGDMMGLAFSVVAAALLSYPMANVLDTDQISPWASALVGSLLPLCSAVCFWVGSRASRGHEADGQTGASAMPGAPAGQSGDFALPPVDARARRLFLRFSACLFIVVCVTETARNLLLGGTAISFYSGLANLGGLMLKIGCAVWLVSVFDDRDARGVSLAYRIAFILLLGVVLCTPLLLQGNLLAHMLLDVGSFFFQLVVLMVAYQIGVGLRFGPVVVFASARAVWAAGVMTGIAIAQLWGGPAATQAFAVALGIAVAVAFAFMFTERDCTDVLASLPEPDHAPRFREKCEHVAGHYGLSARELEVLVLMAKGRSASRVAEDLGVTLATINSHVNHIYRKLGVHSRQELIDVIEQNSD